MGRPSFKESKTAIVIIAWNSDHFIGACVESALSLHGGCSRFELRRQPIKSEFYVSQSRGAPANAGAPLLLNGQF